jgi:hypothetical protein
LMRRWTPWIIVDILSNICWGQGPFSVKDAKGN